MRDGTRIARQENGGISAQAGWGTNPAMDKERGAACYVAPLLYTQTNFIAPGP